MIRTIYGAVRDQNWNTIEGRLTIDRLERSDDFFRLEFTADHEGAPISFLWKGTIEGRGGVLEFRFDGRARSSFLRNRIGSLSPSSDRRVLEFVDLHYAEPITLRQAAALARMSVPQFIRLFKKVAGTTFVSYLNHVRLSRAVRLLERELAHHR